MCQSSRRRAAAYGPGRRRKATVRFGISERREGRSKTDMEERGEFYLEIDYPDVRAEAYVPELKEEGSRIWPMQVLDPWNSASYRGAVATLADKSRSAKLRKEYPKSYDLTRQFVEDRKPHTLNAWQLRETHQHLIPVSVHKDAKCNIPDIGESKYHVRGDMPLGAFVKFIRTYIRDFDAGHPISVSFKNTKPASETLMSKIDAENKDEDGFLHMTYTGEQKEVVGAARSDIIPRRVRRKTAANRAAARVRRKATANRAAARSDIVPGRFKRRKKIGKIQISRWIGLLDPWNHYVYRDYPGTYTPVFLNAWECRAREPDHIPVSVEKDASSDIPDIDMTKYNVHRDMPLKEFVDFIRLRIQHDFPWKKSMFVYFKNTEPPIGTTLISEVDEKNRDKDGWVRITYSGKEKGG